LISGSGEDVGLPDGQMGNSEVGHLTMGAGRVIYQDLTLITKHIREKTFFKNDVLNAAFERAKTNGKAVHILGLLSPGGVHSHEDHIFACIEMAHQSQCKSIYFHALLDGRDTPPKSAMSSLEKLEQVLNHNQAKLASVSGRFYGMDRDQRWERVEVAYNAIVHGQAEYYAQTGVQALTQAYERNETDEFVKPTCIVGTNNQKITIQDGDVVIYMNFRADRARALSYAFTQPDFKGFARSHFPKLGEYVTLTQYDKNIVASVVFKPQTHTNVLGEYLQTLNKTQLHMAETEKYAHVTFFFNGGKEPPYHGEERILIPSPKVKTYDMQPQMSAYELTDALVDNIQNGQFDFIVCNYANADMVGHTGNFEATVKAIEVLDECLGRIIDALSKVGGQALITSDHGNAECMVDTENDQPHTAHTTALVPFVYVGNQKMKVATGGTLSDIAPSILHLMGLTKPNEMTGKSLLQSE
jgi:2,3-bisphosphoglycerate-independent phosphoglycerate mutase